MGSDPVFGSVDHYRSLEPVTGSDPEDVLSIWPAVVKDHPAGQMNGNIAHSAKSAPKPCSVPVAPLSRKAQSEEHNFMANYTDEQELRKTVEGLKRDLRLWKVATVSLAIPVLLMFCAGSAIFEDVPDFVTARRGFVVTDKKGDTRSFLGIEDDGRVGFHLLDEKGNKKIGLAVDPKGDGYGVVIYDGDNRLRTFLGLTKGAYCLHFYDEGSVPRTTIGYSSPTPFSGLCVRDSRGQHRLILGDAQSADKKALNGLFLFDTKGQERLQMFALDKGSPVLQLLDSEERVRARLGLEGAGDKSLLTMLGKGAEERVVIEVSADNSLRFEAKDKANNVTRVAK
jgi:hypothetical protein